MKLPQIRNPLRKRTRLDDAKDAATRGGRWLRRIVRVVLLWLAGRLEDKR
jgi:hypothetical protein